MIEKEVNGEGSDNESQLEDGEMKSKAEKKKFELNMSPEYWTQKFLYPFALDPAPLRLDAKMTPEEIIAEKKRQKLLGDESILKTTKY